MDQLMELQRRLNNANESASQPVSNISALTGLPEVRLTPSTAPNLPCPGVSQSLTHVPNLIKNEI